MDGSLKFADYITIAVIVAAVVLGVQWWQKQKGGGCGCSKPRQQAPAPDAVNLSRRTGVRSCA